MSRCVNVISGIVVSVTVASSASAQDLATQCPSYAPAVRRGELTDARINEASGLAASHTNPGLLWTHNDSGDEPLLYVLDEEGSLGAVWRVTNATARDWEDIALAPCGPDHAGDCLFIADIGNNSKSRTDLVIYRVPEPMGLFSVDAPFQGELEALDSQPIRYPFTADDPPAIPDAEALLVDRQSGALLIATKEETRTRLLRLPAWTPGVTQTLEPIATAPLALVTGGDFHPGGERFVLRTYPYLYQYDLSVSEITGDLNGLAYTRRLTGELQGEAIAYAQDGLHLFTVAEGVGSAIWMYACELPQGEPSPEMDMGSDMESFTPLEPEWTHDMGHVAPTEDMERMTSDLGAEPAPGAGEEEGGCAQGGGAPAMPPVTWAMALLAVLGWMRRREER